MQYVVVHRNQVVAPNQGLLSPFTNRTDRLGDFHAISSTSYFSGVSMNIVARTVKKAK